MSVIDVVQNDVPRAGEADEVASPRSTSLPGFDHWVPGMRRMLIVDDEHTICECLTDFFSARGFAVSTAYSGEEALEHLARMSADVILLDILLPGLSGIEILRRAKEFNPKVRVIMVTGLDQDDLRAKARRYGASAYITKPFDFSEATWAAAFARPL